MSMTTQEMRREGYCTVCETGEEKCIPTQRFPGDGDMCPLFESYIKAQWRAKGSRGLCGASDAPDIPDPLKALEWLDSHFDLAKLDSIQRSLRGLQERYNKAKRRD